MIGIVTTPLVPLRESDNERSELYSQLLFGERVEILETRERWLLVRNIYDSYEGWVDRKMIQILHPSEDKRIAEASRYFVQVPLLICDKTTCNEKMFLPGGGLLPDMIDGKFTIENETYQIHVSENSLNNEISGQRIVNLAMQYLNAPYLWGGKSVFGIDCSGLVQVVFAMVGIPLLRDASQQVDSGKVIDFLNEVKAGDLAFFENVDGKIIHVGIMLNSNQIIHSSGWVKIETIDSQGIISSKTGDYTHNLRVVKRII
ncbi:MAG: C40 family peptidase [Paludibacter sp.]|nr:C40 family peptidase [Paludibacter sp.]